MSSQREGDQVGRVAKRASAVHVFGLVPIIVQPERESACVEREIVCREREVERFSVLLHVSSPDAHAAATLDVAVTRRHPAKTKPVCRYSREGEKMRAYACVFLCVFIRVCVMHVRVYSVCVVSCNGDVGCRFFF